MSVVTYNGVTLPYANTSNFTQEVLLDDVGGVDWYATRYSLSVQCIVNPAYLSQLLPDMTDQGLEAAEVVRLAVQQLKQPRRSLSFQVNGVELIPRPQQGLAGTVDAANGPLPQRVRFMQLTANTFVIDFAITTTVWENQEFSAVRQNPFTNEPGNVVLYNRWEESVNLDANMRSTRTRSGTYRIRSDNVEGKIADQLRSAMAVMSVPDRFRRIGSRYNVSTDGLRLSYSLTDEEVFRMPPRPAYTARGTYTDTTTKLGAWREGMVNLTLEGSPGTSQADLIDSALMVAATKLRQTGAMPGKDKNAFGMLMMCQVTVGMYENSVSLAMRVRMDPAVVGNVGKERKGKVWSLDFDAMANIPGSVMNAPPDYFDRGTANLLLRCAAYYDPNLTTDKLGFAIGEPPAVNAATPTGVQKVQMRGRIPGTAGVNPEA